MATTKEKLLAAYNNMTPEQQAKTYAAGNAQVKQWLGKPPTVSGTPTQTPKITTPKPKTTPA